MQYLAKGSLPPLVTGSAGVGKSSLIRSCLKLLEGPCSITWKHLRFSARTQARDIQKTIEGALEKKRKTKLAPPGSAHLVLFVDDVNMPEPDAFGAQPALELLRQLQDSKVTCQTIPA